MASGPRERACARGPGRRRLLEGDLRTRQLSQGTDNKPRGALWVLATGGRMAGGRGGGRANVATDPTGLFGPLLGTKGPTGSSGLRTAWTGVTVHGAECGDRRHEMAASSGGRRRGGRGRTCPTRAPLGAAQRACPSSAWSAPQRPRGSSRGPSMSMREMWGAQEPTCFGHSGTQ